MSVSGCNVCRIEYANNTVHMPGNLSRAERVMSFLSFKRFEKLYRLPQYGTPHANATLQILIVRRVQFRSGPYLALPSISSITIYYVHCNQSIACAFSRRRWKTIDYGPTRWQRPPPPTPRNESLSVFIAFSFAPHSYIVRVLA